MSIKSSSNSALFNNTASKPKTIMLLGPTGNMGPGALGMFLEKGYQVMAADYMNKDEIKQILIGLGHEKALDTKKLKTIQIDARSIHNLIDKIAEVNPDICVSTLGPSMANNAAVASAMNNVDYVSSNFLNTARTELDKIVQSLNIFDVESFDDLLDEKNTSSKWGRGLDPGLDTWLFRRALKEFEGGKITSIKSVGSGIAENPEDTYFYTWSGITNGMGTRKAAYLKNGNRIDVGPTEKFAQKNRQGFETITLNDGLVIETYLNNEDGPELVDKAIDLGIDLSDIDFAATLTGRHQGHCDFWDPLVKDLGLLDTQHTYTKPMSMNALIADRIKKSQANNINIDSVKTLRNELAQNEFFSDHILGTGTAKDITELHLARIYAPQNNKRDRSIIYIEIKGTTLNGQAITKTMELDSFGEYDMAHGGLTSMQKTVAGTLVRATQLTLNGEKEPGAHGALSSHENGDAILESMEQDGLILITENTRTHGPDIDLKSDIGLN